MNLLNDTLPILAAGTTAPGGWVWAMAIGFTAICLIMMLVVLIQKPKGGGLSGAFGGGAGGGTSQDFLGRGIGDFLTWTTVVCFLLFLGLAMGMTWMIHGSEISDEDEQKQAQKEDSDKDKDESDKEDESDK